MTEEYSSFGSARARLEEIAVQVKDKETPLERCLDLLEEGVKIASRCTELLDHTEWRSAVEEQEGGEQAAEAPVAAEMPDGAPATEVDAATEAEVTEPFAAVDEAPGEGGEDASADEPAAEEAPESAEGDDADEAPADEDSDGDA